MATLFFSYSHKDELLRDELEVHLAMLKREGAIQAWHDRKIPAGDEIDRTINERINIADIILLLVSPDFLASPYCYDVELERALARHEAGEARVIPVILRPCDWHNTPFAKLLAAPQDGRPITRWADRDESFLDVVRQIRVAISQTSRPQKAASPAKPKSEGDVFAALESLKTDIALLRELLRVTEPGVEQKLSDAQIVRHLLTKSSSSHNKRLLEAFKQAEELASQVASDNSSKVTQQHLNQVHERLDRLKQELAVPLRSYQERLATVAANATVAAIQSEQYNIGVLFQDIGSGLSTTLAAYVALVAQHPALHGFTIVVAADRAMLVEQLNRRLREICGFCGRPIVPASGEELKKLLSLAPRPILVTTYQSLRLACGSKGLSGRILLVDYQYKYASENVLREVYRISFRSSVHAQSDSGETILGTYSFQQAVADGYLCPVLVQKRSLPGLRSHSEWEKSEIAIATDIINHFKSSRVEFAGKAIVIARSIATVERLAQILDSFMRADSHDKAKLAVALTGRLPQEQRRQLVADFSSDHHNPTILVAGELWQDIDAPLVNCAYITCRLDAATLRQLPGIVGRPRPGKTISTIVDYAENEFDDLKGWA
jgi:hypothetical protein